MAFNTVTFLFLFLPIAVVLYYIIEKTLRKPKIIIQNIILLILSLVFFAWADINCIYQLLAIIAWNYCCGIACIKWKKSAIIGIIGNVVLFIYLKILPTLFGYINDLSDCNIQMYRIIVPIGFSFILFHCISYLMDIYNGKSSPSKNIIDIALYITFFPKLVQGPIVKYYDFEKSLHERTVNLKSFASGLERFVICLGKKVLIADALSETVNMIFAYSTSGIDTATAWLGSILFTIQIYLDFSGYSDMAIGLCRIFGFDVKENFDNPYFSKSVSEFWRRWHISLGAWFREYLYIPLGGSRKGNVYFNLLVVSLLQASGMAQQFLSSYGDLHTEYASFQRNTSQGTTC